MYIYDKKIEPLYSSTIGLWHRVKNHPEINTSPDNLMLSTQIHTEKDIERTRRLMFKTIWGNNNSYLKPTNKFESSQNSDAANTNAEYYTTKVMMEYGIESTCQLLEAKKEIPSNSLVIYHQGHGGSYAKGSKIIKRLLDLDFDILAMEMPLMGQNNKPVAYIHNLGNVKLSNHNRLQLLKLKEGIPIKFFIEPVIRCKEAAIQKNKYEKIHMIGLSGGGWTTTLAAALDPDIETSAAVAGALPIALREYDLGDYEQYTIDLYSKVNYIDMFILGSYGQGRHQLQIFNVYDSCCFRGYRAKSYERILEKSLKELGRGEVSVWHDETHWSHKISDSSMSRIIQQITRKE